MKLEYLCKRGRREFVVLTIEDFERMKEAIEDAEDLRALRKATQKTAKERYYTAAEVRQMLPRRSPASVRTRGRKG